MKHTRRCSECGSTDIRTTTVWSGGGHSPDLLPGAHPWLLSGRIEIYICAVCGYFQYFVPPEYLAKVRESKKFTPYV